MEFGREAVADYLAKNKIPKLDLSGAIDGMMDFNSKLDEIVKDIRDKKDNAMAMEFVKVIGGMLRQNGVSVKIEECRDEKIAMNMAENKIEVKYNVRIDGLDFTEHDMELQNKIEELEQEINALRRRCKSDSALHAFDVKSFYRLHIVSKDIEAENEALKKRIYELEREKAETCVKEPISDDCRPSIEWYENRYQSDCIEINRLNTTIDVLIHKIEYLRQFAGLE